MNYLTDLMYKIPELKQQIGLIEQACATTIFKYDMNAYQNQTKNALDMYCIDGKVGGFSNDNNVRTYLDQYGDRKNAEVYVKCALNNERKTNPKYSYTSVLSENKNFRKVYADMIYEKMTVNKYNSNKI